MNFRVAATMIPRSTGNGMAPFQSKRAAPPGCCLTSESAPNPPAALTVPANRSKAARAITPPCTTSVLTTEMNPPVAV